MNQIIYSLNFLILLLILTSCEKEDMMKYDRNRSAIEFNGKSYTYSFKKTAKEIDTVSIPFSIVGYADSREKNAEFIIIADSTTTHSDNYEIIDAIVEPNEYKGNLRVRVKNTAGDNFVDSRVYFEIANGKDFIPGIDINKNYFLYLTNKLIRPISWQANKGVEKFYLGTYSTAYYQFIIEATGEVEFPFMNAIAGYNNGEVWNTAEGNAFLDNLTQKLADRNKSVGKKLLHDDGAAQGLEVIVGKYYEF